MASSQVKLLKMTINKQATKEMFRSPQLINALDQVAEGIEERANSMAKSHNLSSKKYRDYSHKVGINNAGFANATVYTSSYMGKLDTHKHNTLLKAVK